MGGENAPFEVESFLLPPGEAAAAPPQLRPEHIRSLLDEAQSGQAAPEPGATREFARAVVLLSDRLQEAGHGAPVASEILGDLRVDFRRGAPGLGPLFDWQASLLIALLEQHRAAWDEAGKLVQYPSHPEAAREKDTAARALLMVSRSEGEAREEWLNRSVGHLWAAAKANPFDYTAHLGYGLAVLELHDKPEAALPSLVEAATTAQTAGDGRYERRAGFYVGRAYGKLGRLEEAYEATQRACEGRTEGGILWYECARYCALTGRTGECVERATYLLHPDAIGGEVPPAEAAGWWARLRSAPDFEEVLSQVGDSLEALHGKVRSTARRSVTRATKAVTTVEKMAPLAARWATEPEAASAEVGALVQRLTASLPALPDRDDYYGQAKTVHEARGLAMTALAELRQVLSASKSPLDKAVQVLRARIQEAERKAAYEEREALVEAKGVRREHLDLGAVMQESVFGGAARALLVTLFGGAAYYLLLEFVLTGGPTTTNEWGRLGLAAWGIVFAILAIGNLVSQLSRGALKTSRLKRQLNTIQGEVEATTATLREELESAEGDLRALVECLESLRRDEDRWAEEGAGT